MQQPLQPNYQLSSRLPAIQGAADDLAPPTWEVAGLLVSCAVLGLLFLFGGYPVVNLLTPVATTAILGLSSVRLARRMPEAIWTPLFGVRVACIAYFGIGGFVPFVFDAVTQEHAYALYPYSVEEGAKVNLIWLSFTALLLLGAKLARRGSRSAAAPVVAAGADRTLPLGLAFFAAGFAFNWLVWMPTNLAWISFPLPGVVVFAVEAISSCGIFLLAYWGFGRGTKGYVLVAALILQSVLLGLIVMNKQAIILPQLLICLAWLMRGVTISKLAVIISVMLVTFWIIGPIVSFGRERIVSGEAESIIERLDSVRAWTVGENAQAEASTSINPLTRLTFFNAAAYVVTLFDLREPSNSIEMSFAAIIPRVIWPDKPILTEMNRDLFYNLTGTVGTAITTTVPADLYWNFGWAGVILISPLLGFLAMFASHRCYRIVLERDWFMMPFALLCFRISLSVDSQFVNAVFTPAVMASLIYIALSFGQTILPGACVPTNGRGRGAAQPIA